MTDKHDSSSSADLREVRREYSGEPLRVDSAASDPITQFAQWMKVATKYQPQDCSCMVLATADIGGAPSVRTVLLKHFDQKGFCWYSNSGSMKGQQLEVNRQAALQFYWSSLHRQVRISGEVEVLPREEAEAYFNSRPFGSKVSASVSRQSEAIASRAELEAMAEEMAAQYPNGDVPCPQDWCGYRLSPAVMEFWQGRENRLHDRLQYSLQAGQWRLKRLAP